MKNDLGIGLGPELVLGDEFLPQIPEVVDFAVADNSGSTAVSKIG